LLEPASVKAVAAVPLTSDAQSSHSSAKQRLVTGDSAMVGFEVINNSQL